MISDTQFLIIFAMGFFSHIIWAAIWREVKTWDSPQIYDWAKEND
jgi:hypothetical protein